MALVPWDSLVVELVRGSSDPVSCHARVVAKANALERCPLHLELLTARVAHFPALDELLCAVRADQLLVDIACNHTKYIIFIST